MRPASCRNALLLERLLRLLPVQPDEIAGPVLGIEPRAVRRHASLPKQIEFFDPLLRCSFASSMLTRPRHFVDYRSSGSGPVTTARCLSSIASSSTPR
jgi:hypothetical protein